MSHVWFMAEFERTCPKSVRHAQSKLLVLAAPGILDDRRKYIRRDLCMCTKVFMHPFVLKVMLKAQSGILSGGISSTTEER